eukprot:1156370-Pelagomonas_calceolata.AAC.9
MQQRHSPSQISLAFIPFNDVCRIKSELDSQRASLLAVLEEQNQQLKAAKEHGVHMEEQAESAQAQHQREWQTSHHVCMKFPEFLESASCYCLWRKEKAKRRLHSPNLAACSEDKVT